MEREREEGNPEPRSRGSRMGAREDKKKERRKGGDAEERKGGRECRGGFERGVIQLTPLSRVPEASRSALAA